MSRGYAATWVSVDCRVQHADHLELGVALLGVLPDDQMRALLREELARDGWRARGDGGLERDVAGATAVLAPDASKVTVAHEAQVRVASVGVDRASAEANLEAQAEHAKARLGAEGARSLAAVETTLRASLDAAVQRVYVEALKRKAATLGHLESVQETRGADGELEVTIKVRV